MFIALFVVSLVVALVLVVLSVDTPVANVADAPAKAEFPVASVAISFLHTIGVYGLLQIVGANKENVAFEFNGDVATITMGGDEYRFCGRGGFVMFSFNGNSFAALSCPSKESMIERAETAKTEEHKKGATTALAMMGI
jgi:hypothetical protein